MRLAFLGTGAAMSLSRYNAAIAVDGKMLLDGGAPVLVNLSRLNLEADDIRTVLLSHYHGDHTVGLGTFLIRRVFMGGPPLTIMGPAGTEQQIDALCRALWGELWDKKSAQGFDLRYAVVEAGTLLQAGGYDIEVVRMEHDNGFYHGVPSVGYIVNDGSVRLGYGGDSSPGPWVDELLERCDAAIVECTGPSPGPTHLSEEYVRELIRRHPGRRFFLTHFSGAAPEIAGATMAADLATFEIAAPIKTA